MTKQQSTTLAALAERYMEKGPRCVCCGAPGTAPFIFVGHPGSDGMARCCIFAVCSVCKAQDDAQDRIMGALWKDLRERMARCN
jgi:hypothetical protein